MLTEEKIEFTKQVYLNLIQQGYTHIYSRGTLDQKSDTDNDFFLVPLKADDPRLRFEESDLIIEDIHSSEVLDMLNGDPILKFYISTTDL
jgi:hypothetical protein